MTPPFARTAPGDGLATDGRRHWSRTGVLVGVALLVAGAARGADSAVGESWRLRERPEVVIDGAEADWDRGGWRVEGVNTPEERLCVGKIGRGWCTAGLLCAIRAFTPPAAWDGRIAVEVFTDVRPRDAEMTNYEPGVARLEITGTMSKLAATLRRGTSAAVPLQVGADLRVAVAARPDGWFLEALIPWRTLETTAVAPGTWMGFSVRARVSDTAGATAVLGVRDVEAKNPVATTPIAIEPLQVSSPARGRPPGLCVRADETVLAGKPWLALAVAAPKSDLNLERATLSVDAPGIGRVETRFAPSAGGTCWVAELARPLPAGLTVDPELRVTVTGPAGSQAWTELVPTPVAERLAQIDAALPDARVDALPGRARGLGFLLKGCAEDAALLLCPQVEDGRAAGKRARPVEFPGIYDERIARFVRMAQRVAAAPALAEQFPIRAWRSRIDGAWLPYRVVRPWAPAAVPAVQLTLNGARSRHDRAALVEPDVLAYDEGELSPAYGDRVQVEMFERSEHDPDLEREALDEFLTRIVPEEGGPDAIAGIEGVSAGGRRALKLALNHPDRFAFLRLVSAPVPIALLGEASNLRGTVVRMAAGANDTAVARANRLLADALHDAGVDCAYEQLPDTGHYFCPPGLDPRDLLRRREPHPADVTLTAFSPDAGENGWLRIEALTTWGVPARLAGHRDGVRLLVKADNVARFSVRREALPASTGPWQLVVNGTELGSWTESATLTFQLGPQGRFARAESSGEASPARTKRAGRAGPAWRIDSRPVAVIYGTRRADRGAVLRHRAIDVLRQHLGFGATQVALSSYVVWSDDEAATRDLAGCNLWLIGDAAENGIVAALRERNELPALPPTTEEPDALTSYIYPWGAEPGGYVYHEYGTSALAYTAPVLPEPDYDFCRQVIRRHAARVVRMANFNSTWSLPSPTIARR